MEQKVTQTSKELVIAKKDGNLKYLMAKGEYTNIIVDASQSNGEYVISDGILEPNGFIPDHYHKWEDQTFHILEGELTAKIGEETYQLQAGDSVHCPRGISHYMKNNGSVKAKLLSYIFPGHWAEEFMAETSRQNQSGKHDLSLIEEKFGVVYL
ncbi:hypothetical protein BKI52_09105 [marine bacterium AO1-C]|nr:hypothetical protein BKI52_09105 [marine bacterium AO1-C]